MDVGKVLSVVSEAHLGHARRRSEFTLPSAIYLGHEITVRRVDENSRGVSQSDIHFLMHAHVPPGESRVLKHHVGKPVNKFLVYMSAAPSDKPWQPEASTTRPRNSSWVTLPSATKSESNLLDYTPGKLAQPKVSEQIPLP